ncbi:GvpL/GvpF family gas vesicle protein [Streptomyces globosus]
MPVYVYAVTLGDHPCRLDGITGVGSGDAPLRTVPAGDLKAVVSDVNEEVSPRRRDLVAHQAVQDRLLEDGTPLPLQFGYTAPDYDAVRQVLKEQADLYLGALERVRGCVEYNVKASWDEEDILRRILEESPSARSLNEQIRAGTDDPRLALELGQYVADEVQQRHSDAAAGIVDTLVPLAREHAVHAPTGEDFLNLSLLVPRGADGEGALQVAHADLVAGGGTGVDIRVAGPLPPYSFVA